MERSTVKAAVDTLLEEIKTSLQGENAAHDIKEAVNKMNSSLSVTVSNK